MLKTQQNSKVINQQTDNLIETIDWVGIDSMNLPIQYRFQGHLYRTAAQIDIAVGLDKGEYKGIDMAELYFNAQMVASYQPLPEKNSSTPGSYEPWIKAQESTSHYRRKARKVGPAFDNLVLEQIKRGEGLIDTAKVMGYLGLLKHWPYEQLEAVAIHCLKRRNFNFRYFKSCLEVGHE